MKLNGVIDSTARPRPTASRIRALAASPPVLLGGLLLAAFIARLLLARDVLAPWVMPDELQYAEVSRSFLSTGHYLLRDHPQALRTIYPALISPAWLASSTETAYSLIKAINVAMVTLGAIPLYLWARRLVTPLWGLVAVVLYLAMPGVLYTGEIMTENAFLPATILALFAIASALERPTLLRQMLAFAGIALVAATRLQGLIFLVILPTAILLTLLLDAVAAAPAKRRRVVAARAKRFWPTLAVLAFGFLAFVAVRISSGGSISSGLGTYHQLSSADYQLKPALRWIAFHFGELSFSVGLLPVAALALLFGLACRRTTSPAPAERVFLAVTAAALVWIVVEVGTFASHFTLRIEERYMFSVGPALFLALVIWLARGLPRPPGLTAVAVLVPVSFLLALPFEAFFTGALFNDTFGLIPLWRLTTRLGGDPAVTRIWVGLGVLVAGILFAGLPRSWARIAVPLSVSAFLVLSSGSVYAQVTRLSDATRYDGGLVGDPSWIDHAVGRNARVNVIYTADLADPHVAWQAEFWNRSVRRLFGVSGQDPSIPDLTAPFHPATGRITPVLPPGSPDLNSHFVVAAKGVSIAGKPLAQGGFLTLFKVSSPLRLARTVEGLQPDHWTGATAAYNGYVAGGMRSTLRVLLSRKGIAGPPPARVRLTIGQLLDRPGKLSIGKEWATRTVLVRNGRQALVRLPVRAAPFRVELQVAPTFSPSRYGSADTRMLGVRAFFLSQLG